MAFGGLASALQHSITTKPDWVDKLCDPSIVEKWKGEFVAQTTSKDVEDAGLNAAAAGRVFDAAVASLSFALRSANDFDVEYQSDCTTRPLKLTVDDERAFGVVQHCDCGCYFCQEGCFSEKSSEAVANGCGTVEDEEVADVVEAVWRLERPQRRHRAEHGTAETFNKSCANFRTHKRCVEAHRRAYLDEHIYFDPAAALLAPDVKRAVTSLFDRLEQSGTPDWHPGSNEMMQDLIHPSLGCWVRGLHDRLAAPIADVAAAPAKRLGWLSGIASIFTRMAAALVERPKGKSTFQWLPADIELDAEGHVVQALGRGFQGCPDAETNAILLRVLDAVLPAMSEVVQRCVPSNSPHGVPLRNRTIQVIVKAASAKLTQDKPTFPEGAWHLEGVAAEQIIATAIYYPAPPTGVSEEAITPSSLAFRVSLDRCVLERYGSADVDFDQQFDAIAHLGTVPTRADTLLVFPNFIQHKVSSYSIAPFGAESIRRRVLVFWLVSPAARIASTVDVPDPTLGGMISRAEQLVYREQLMLERKFAIAAQSVVFERPISLCEH